MTTLQKFENLNGSKISRKDLQDLILEAKIKNETVVVYRLSKILLDNPTTEVFEIELKQYPTSLNAPRHKGSYKEALSECGRLKKGWKFEKGNVVKKIASKTPGKKNNTINDFKALGIPFIENPETVADDFYFLGAPLTSDDIYKMITDKMVSLVKTATGSGYKKKWGNHEYYEKDGFLIPFNFITKKQYRGVNYMMLKENDLYSVFDNPYFLTFKQVKAKGGTIKKGSKGKPIIYFTILYKYENKEKNIDFGTYNEKKMIAFLKKKGISVDDYITLPIIKYYNIFNGADIDGIDFKLENIKAGKVFKSQESKKHKKNELAELIVKHYPKPVPPIKHKGGKAYYSVGVDSITMPRFNLFETPNDYYRTLFHEITHSTGDSKRLNRDFSGKFGSVNYAKEELIAEFGAVFLSAQAGIIWHSNKNHEEYIKGWSKALKIAADDTRFLMRAASAAQKAADYVLNLNELNEPAFYKDLNKIVKTKSEQLKLALAGTAKTKETVSFNKKIIKAKRNGLDFRKNYSLGRSKGVLKKHIGDHEIIISGGVLKKAMEKDKDHIATYENFINFPDAINEPLAIFNSKTKKDSKIVLTEVISYKEKPLMVALHFNKINGVFRIASVYSKTNTSVYKKWFKEGLCVYYNKKSSNELLLAPIAVSHTVKGRNKDTKNNSTSKVFKKKGLGNPLQDHNSLAYKLSNRQNRVTEFYNISENDIAEFLGKIEKKEKESVVITVTGGQGSMKTRYAFRFMDALAKNYKVGHASIEEHPDSSLYWNKVHEYISEQSLQNISNPEINDIQQLDHLIKSNDVIIIDSFAKMQELERGFEVDKDLRKKYDGKLFLVIFQQTSDGKMRGGTKSQYDADIVLFTEKFDDYEQNFVYADKNRYQNKTLCDLKYNIFKGKLNPLEPREKEISIV